MDKTKLAGLETKGWRTVALQELLGLTDAEVLMIDLRLDLARRLKSERERIHLTQSELARRLRSSQSRVAKLEAGDPSVSVDLLVRALLALGLSRAELGVTFAGSTTSAAGKEKPVHGGRRKNSAPHVSSTPARKEAVAAAG